MRDSIALLGVGWLGEPLAAQLSPKYELFRSMHKRSTALEFGKPIFYHYPNPLPSELHQKKLIITLPPSVLIDAETFSQVLDSLDDDTYVLYCSSTGVYQGLKGVIDEGVDGFDINSARVQKLLHLEKCITNKFKRSALIRLGGLVGEGRNPANFFKSIESITDPEEAINLVHQLDACRFIEQVMEAAYTGVFNAVAPYHPSRISFYSKMINQGNGIEMECQPNASIVMSNRQEMSAFKFEFAERLLELGTH